MKPWIFWKWSIGVLLASLPLAGRGLEPAQSTTPPTLLAESAAEPGPEAADSPAAALDISSTNAAPATDIAEAPAKSIANEKPLPAHIRPGAPVAEVIRLANSGLDQSVMLAFVTNSTGTFNLGAEEIIYLNDIGVPSAVVTAMIQRDQELRNAGGAAAPGAGVTPPFEPTPAQVAPQAVDTAGAVPEEPAPGAEVVDDASFYNSLSPYGSWVDLGGYGWCWQPTVVVVNPYWQPYFDCGHWVYSDCGWYWSSSYSWGWAPFHYGRWFRHHHLGWCWMPDTVWGPSWVSWRYGDHFCGWAPLPPGSHFTAGVGLTFHGRPVREHEDCGLVEGHYRFVAWEHFQDRQIAQHRLLPHQQAWAYHNSTVVTRISGDGRTIINNGLPPSRVAAATRTPIRTVSLHEFNGAAPRSGRAEQFDLNGRTLEVYRPHLAPTSPARNPVPGKRADTSPVSPAGSRPSVGGPAPWLNHEAVATISPGRISGTGATVSDNHGQSSVSEQPLILRGPQSSALRERAPSSSLIVIGRKDANGRSITTMTVPEAQARNNEAMAGTSQAALRPDPLANASSRSAPNAAARSAEIETSQRNLPWLAQRGDQVTHFDDPRPAYRPEVPRYQAPAWKAPAEVPRYAPGPMYQPQRSYSAPTMSAPARAPAVEYRSAGPAPSAPSAPAASHSQPSSSGRNSR